MWFLCFGMMGLRIGVVGTYLFCGCWYTLLAIMLVLKSNDTPCGFVGDSWDYCLVVLC